MAGKSSLLRSTMTKYAPVDLSHHLHPGMQLYPGGPPYTSRPVKTIPNDGYGVHEITLGSHTGTHIDVPSHFFSTGKTVDQMPLSTFIGTALVIDLTHKKAREKIVWEDLVPHKRHMKKDVILLLHTGWSDHWGTPKYYEHPYLDPVAASKILQKGIRVVGIDAISADETRTDGTAGQDGFGVHNAILGSGGIIAENLTNLKALHGNGFTVSLVPLNLDGIDGSPVRAYAWRKGCKWWRYLETWASMVLSFFD